MADAHTSRLCAEIIQSHFGPITSKVVSVLLTRGRLNIHQLIRFTNVKARTLRAAILVLVQHNILWHAQTEDEGEVFEVSTDECLIRLRFGKFVLQTETLFGKAAADIVQTILDHGKLRPPQILSLLSVYDSKAVTVYTQALHKLVNGHYLKPSTLLSQVSPRDKRIKYEAEEKAKISGFPTAKEIKQAKEVAAARLRQEEDEAEKAGMKRRAKDQPGSRQNKRKIAADEDVVDDSVYFRINYDKFNVHIRNFLFSKAAKERFNEGASMVMETAMKVTEAQQLDVAEVRSDPIAVASVLVQLSDADTLKTGLIYSSKKVSNATCIKDYMGLLACADNPTPAGRAAKFVSYSSSKIQVEFQIIGRRLRWRVLESIVREKHGPEGIRVLRLLLDTGKMDEKQISKSVMMAPKDVRPLLSAMATDSFISTQEVPRTADRNPARTFYLWYVDLQKAYTVILDSIYKTLYNISMRRRAELEVGEVKVVLEKRERTDVRQDENLLTRLERDILKEWQVKQEKLLVLEMRVEETLFVMKDLAVLGINNDDS